MGIESRPTVKVRDCENVQVAMILPSVDVTFRNSMKQCRLRRCDVTPVAVDRYSAKWD